jgi:alpha-tubulin suppressor-like RCC1 family protein
VSAGVQCWGENYNGQLASTLSPPLRMALSVGVGGVTAVAAGGKHSCAIVAGGKVRCWGAGRAGQLGNNALGNSVMPVAVSGW